MNKSKRNRQPNLSVWKHNDGSVVSCSEKIKVMNDNLDELKQISQDAFEDGLLMDIDETQLRQALHQIVDSLINPYKS